MYDQDYKVKTQIQIAKDLNIPDSTLRTVLKKMKRH